MVKTIQVTISNGAAIPAKIGSDMAINARLEQTKTIIQGGTYNYEELNKKPQINGVTLIGNKSTEDIGIEEISNLELEALINAQL